MEKAESVLEEFINKGSPDLFNATVGDIYSMWSEAHFEQISKKTADCYRSVWKHFEPIAGMKIREARAIHFQNIVNAHIGAGVSREIKALSKALCRFAVENDLIDKNYAEFIKLPKISKTEKMTFSTTQIAELWRHSGDRNVQAILVMIYMGFRIGEMTALTTGSINLRAGYITGGIKTDAGKDRIVPFPANIPEIRDFVTGWVRSMPPGERLFPVTEHTFRARVFYATLIRLGMINAELDNKGAIVFHEHCHLTPHSTRHTFASLSVAAGMRPERLQKIIGHASYRTTADYYVHIDHQALSAEMGKLIRDCT
ncbi:MAG: tyrosine-type recombinase/integrase [Ruminiclostridium sp.]|nr:tyrosine-type recombinase/integrase [Ruminiclostridium sp.]